MTDAAYPLPSVKVTRMSGPRFGLTGLAVMGANLARNVAHHDIPIAVHNRTASKTEQFMAEHGSEGPLTGTGSTQEFVAALERPRTIMTMVKAGPAVDAVIEELAPLLDEGDTIVDGGNSHFRDTQRRDKAMAERGLRFLGVGVSGGEEGALHGPSIMPGGASEAYADVEDVFTAIAAQVDGTPCCTYVGADGAGHYVKMVHNGIEYADIQLIAEVELPALRLRGRRHLLEALRVGDDLGGVERLAHVVDQRAVGARVLAGRRPAELRRRRRALVAERGQAAREHRLGDRGQRHAELERVLRGPAPGALLLGLVEDHVDQRPAGALVGLVEHLAVISIRNESRSPSFHSWNTCAISGTSSPTPWRSRS